MAKPKHIDWEKVETDYITGNESQRTLAARFVVSVSELAKRCKAGEWVKKRKEFRREACANAVQKCMRAREEEILEGLRGTDLVNKRAIEMLESGMFLEYICVSRQPCKEMEAISKVFLNTEEARRLLRGVMKPAEEEKMKLEREKWDHEVRREAEEERGNAHVDVIFHGCSDEEAEEYSQ